ncbi:4-hydroxy-tetrahydrodipicolinate synthase [Fervidobacterium nodosum]|uniref:4-hydroxy-tetrahydrodipicolinate synthase n=1 Tax=Fervidobacterium nodosum (strain ATCC 35602 / DSM 5306 / Rt17-B1) TaxID=381764 RepID=DAPA_FERNB|nr:4-hydroxy-tetrahydrodipicolinate synthase [Fervidobacterium nodosum]A7HJ56.2 RecName: Full=4-hydroxy-tetrahydrodipicolinate synthase; Short=HTPA synthase [Fervidobacterium nodosum Rt17-B1]PHJ12540.1 4-hydroxy-tetrahydrodipicolinate synthase [Fervidobacterium sp. SC_NGM5_G05]HOJ93989.1 4-hydroxy-tetrahydrodipicolinate synthase [Fervidobacterium nodosum]
MFTGVGTAIVTPFSNGEVDYGSYEKLVRWQIESGVKAIVVAGTTGEGVTLTVEEREKLVALTKQICEGKAQVIVGTGTNDTRKTLELSLSAEKSGADALLIVTPYYNKPTQEGLYAHYKYLSERLSKPIIIYNVPSRTGVNISPETVARLASDCKNIVAIKEANTDVNQADEIYRLTNGDFYIYSGNDDRAFHMICAGAKGVISVASNIIPEQMVELANKTLQNDVVTARNIHFKYLELMKVLFVETNPIPVKAALNLLGIIKNELRLPLVPAKQSTVELLEKVMKKVGVLS